jgi:heme/copper-type cytochrome/quinol oxidase subunit 1
MTPPAARAGARPELVTESVPRRRPAWIERATSSDHKSLGVMYIGAALTFALAAVTALVVMRVQLIVPENTTTDPEIFNRVMSSFAITGVVLFAIPLALGLFSYISPLQVGARGVAFPRLGLLSFWLYVAGGFTIFGSFLWRPSEAGFAALPPLSEPLYSNTHGVDTWIIGTALAVLGLVCFAVNLVVTLRTMRAPGMAWRRVPAFTWAANLGGYLLLVCGPVMLAALVMLFVDRNYGGVFFDPGYGGAPILYEHLAAIEGR